MRNATLITEFLGNDLAHISNELGKIIINLPEGTTISEEVIEEQQPEPVKAIEEPVKEKKGFLARLFS